MQSAPRVRLSFKGELARPGPAQTPPTPSSDFCSPFPPRGGYASSFYLCKDGISCHMSNSTALGTKGGCYVCLGTAEKLPPHPEPDYTLTRFMAGMMTQRGNT